MKKNILLAALFLLTLANCKNSNNTQNQQNSVTSTTELSKYPNSKLIIYYFHSTQRCPTCLSVEKNTKEILEESYKPELENNQIVFKSINFVEKENEELAKKYQISMSTILLVYNKNQKEEVSDLTNIAFSFSRNEPETFKTILNDTIQKILKINN